MDINNLILEMVQQHGFRKVAEALATACDHQKRLIFDADSSKTTITITGRPDPQHLADYSPISLVISGVGTYTDMTEQQVRDAVQKIHNIPKDKTIKVTIEVMD